MSFGNRVPLRIKEENKMKMYVNFGQVEAYGEECKMWSFLNAHLIIYKSCCRFRWLIEIS